MVIALGRSRINQSNQDIIGRTVLLLLGKTIKVRHTPLPSLADYHPDLPRELRSSVLKLIPSDADCCQALQRYRGTVHIIYPGIVAIVTNYSRIGHDSISH